MCFNRYSIKLRLNKKSSPKAAFCDSPRTRTWNLLLRRQLLYPVELANLPFQEKTPFGALRREGDYSYSPPCALPFMNLWFRTLGFSSPKIVYHQFISAERGGFEPPVRFPARMFSKHVVSATHPPLRAYLAALKKGLQI